MKIGRNNQPESIKLLAKLNGLIPKRWEGPPFGLSFSQFT